MGFNKVGSDYWKTARPSCNCGSYALNLDDWFLPYDSSDDRDDFIADQRNKGYSCQEIYDMLLDYDGANIVEADPSLVSITAAEYEQLPLNVEVIAYRVGINNFDDDWEYPDDDFHFRVRRGGIWYEKTGIYDPQKCDEQDVFAPWVVKDEWIDMNGNHIDEYEYEDEDDYFFYDSDMLLFIHKFDLRYLENNT